MHSALPSIGRSRRTTHRPLAALSHFCLRLGITSVFRYGGQAVHVSASLGFSEDPVELSLVLLCEVAADSACRFSSFGVCEAAPRRSSPRAADTGPSARCARDPCAARVGL
eukprot:1119576-Pleurochrysis_carterae.AAC.1